MPDKATRTVQRANDSFRRGDPSIPGQWVITQGLSAMLKETGRVPLEVIETVRAFEKFTEDNDPYKTHEFGSFEFQGETCFWKIDLYDNDLRYGSPEPTDLSVTTRVMTVFLASEC